MAGNKPKQVMTIEGKNFPSLAVLFPDELHFIQSIAEPMELVADVPIIKEGQVGKYLYLVQQGVLRVNKRHNKEIYEVGSITPGNIFGEVSVLYETPAGAEVRTTEHTQLYRLPAQQVRDVINGNERFFRSISQLAESRAAASAIAVNPIFFTLPQTVREVALYNGQFVSFEAGGEVMREGDSDTRYMYIVISGEAVISMKHPREPGKRIILARISSGDEVGEISVVTGKTRAATVTATTPLRLLQLNTDSIQFWRERYSDFGYSLYACAQHKLQHSMETLRDIIDPHEAMVLTTGTLPPLVSRKIIQEAEENRSVSDKPDDQPADADSSQPDKT